MLEKRGGGEFKRGNLNDDCDSSEQFWRERLALLLLKLEI